MRTISFLLLLFLFAEVSSKQLDDELMHKLCKPPIGPSAVNVKNLFDKCLTVSVFLINRKQYYDILHEISFDSGYLTEIF